MAKRAATLAAMSALHGVWAGTCPDMPPYAEEASPFGWPLTPMFSYDHQECWGAKNPFCKGVQQSPMDIDLSESSGRCETEAAGQDGALKDAATYWSAGVASGADWTAMGLPPRPVVKVSKYLRTVMTEGPFGKLHLKDQSGKDVLYEATQVHVTPQSMHTVNETYFDAEMLVMHRPSGAKDLLGGSVIVSVLFRVSDAPSSPVFDSLGANLMKGEEWTVDPFGIADTLNPALMGPSYQYNGSVPVPPCSERVTWIVLGAVQSISREHLQKLQQVVGQVAGGWHKRWPVSRHLTSSICRKIVKNGLKVSPDHEAATCSVMPAGWMDKTSRDIRCGAGAQCLFNPKLEATAAQTKPSVNIDDILHYTPQEHVTMVPTPFTLDATAGHDGFGHIMLNGRAFTAHTMSMKASAFHTIDGKRYAGQLTIWHTPYGAPPKGVAVGKESPSGDHSPAPAHGASVHGSGHDASGHGSGHGAGHRRLDQHRDPVVMVSVPLKLGKESPLLRRLGLGQEALARAIRDGNSYSVHQTIDLEEELRPVLGGSWYWYTAGENSHQCGGDHYRWMVMETPLEVSFEQLNDLSLNVSGFDSTFISAVEPAHLWRGALPLHAVETPHANTGVCNQPWSYKDTHCWNANFSACGGSRQSPINIKAGDVMEVGNDNFLSKCSWKPVKGLDVENSGRGLQVVNNQMGYFAFIDDYGNQTYYQVSGLKLHMPSEHMINNKQYDAELQIVHQRQKAVNELEADDLAITSFLFQLGEEESPLLRQFHLPGHAVQEGAPTKMDHPLDLMRALGPALDGSYYRYDGSLTVPDCSETAKWWVFETPMSMSQAQKDAFKQLFPGSGNNRPIQELNGRTVARNSFLQGTLKQYGFYLNRWNGRSRSDWNRSTTLILIPIIFTVFFTIYVMASLFVREDKVESSGGLSAGAGLEQTVGRAQSPYSRF